MRYNDINHDLSTFHFMTKRFIHLFNLHQIYNTTWDETYSELVNDMHEVSKVVYIWT